MTFKVILLKDVVYKNLTSPLCLLFFHDNRKTSVGLGVAVAREYRDAETQKVREDYPNRDGCGQLPANVPSAWRRCNGRCRRRYPPTVRPIWISHGIIRRCIVVESVNRSSDEKRTQRRAGITCPSSLFYICKSVGTYQRCDVPTNLRIHISIGNRVIIKGFLSASADGKVCIELLDTF